MVIKEIVLGPKKLNCDIISKAQNILKKQFSVQGLSDPLHGRGSGRFPIQEGHFVQILQSGDHWIVDSLLAGDLSGDFRRHINDIRGQSTIVNIMFCQQQDNDIDCGVFALANAYCLCTATPLRKLAYKKHLMREHLLQCIVNSEFTMFPHEGL